MPRARSVALALTTMSLVVPTGALAQGAGGAGDDQYTDPFAGQGSSSGNGSQDNGDNGNGDEGNGDNGLSQNPDLSGGDDTSGSGTSTTGTGTSTTGTETALADTGADLRLMILAGLTLVLAGTGLRLRTADEKF